MSSDFEEHGRFYLQRQTIQDPDGGVHVYYEIGQISEVTGRYKPSMDESFKTRESAIEWIEKQK